VGRRQQHGFMKDQRMRKWRSGGAQGRRAARERHGEVVAWVCDGNPRPCRQTKSLPSPRQRGDTEHPAPAPPCSPATAHLAHAPRPRALPSRRPAGDSFPCSRLPLVPSPATGLPVLCLFL
jgi:hypothetical protein